jgi:hypothetical protein
MRIDQNTTTWQCAELMGSGADYHDGAALLEILEREGISDTDSVSADDWSRMIEQAAADADKARAEKPY